MGLENGSLVLWPVPKRAGSDRPAAAGGGCCSALARAEALLDFTDPADLAVWLEKHKGSKPLGRRQPPAGGERNPTQYPGRQHLKNSEGAKRGDEPGLRLPVLFWVLDLSVWQRFRHGSAERAHLS